MSKLPKPFVPITEDHMLIVDTFKKLPYDQQAEVFRDLSILFDKIMELQRFEQHRAKIDAVQIEDIEIGLYRLTNIHENVHFAQFDLDGYEKYGVEGHLYWPEGQVHHTFYIKGGLDKVCERIANL